MSRKIMICVLIVGIFFILLSNSVWAETAVTIKVTASHPSAQDSVTTIDLIVPQRPLQAPPLKIGDLVFFQIPNPPPSLAGISEGIITSIYETQDKTIKKAIFLDHVLSQ